MDNLTAVQTDSNSQPQGTSEKTTEKKEKNSFPQAQSQLSRRKKIILGIATFGIIFYTGTFFLDKTMLANSYVGNTGGHILDFGGIAEGVALLPFSILLYPAIILSFVLTIIYLKKVFKNKRISKIEKIFWALVFFHGFYFINIRQYDSIYHIDLAVLFNLLNFLILPYIVMSIYWYRYIWEGTRLNQLIKSRYWYIYALIFLYIVIYLIPQEISLLAETVSEISEMASEIFEAICQYNLCINW
ncbi:divalent metal cation transporter [Patescibacteria group bacterium]|nr:divalent metal cation transporter [Patescibacteria group bacterium]